LRLAKSRGQLAGLAGNLFEYLPMFLEFLKHYVELYRRRGATAFARQTYIEL
jgi:hypothetical protein